MSALEEDDVKSAKIQALTKKVLKYEEELRLLRLQMNENNTFREELWEESKDSRKKRSDLLEDIKALKAKLSNERKRNKTLQRQQSNFKRKIVDEQKRTVKSTRNAYWDQVLTTLERENEHLKDIIQAMKEEKIERDKELDSFKKIVKKEKNEKRVEMDHTKNLLKKAKQDLGAFRLERGELIEQNNDLKVEVRSLKSIIHSLEKKLEQMNSTQIKMANSTVLSPAEKRIIEKRPPVPRLSAKSKRSKKKSSTRKFKQRKRPNIHKTVIKTEIEYDDDDSLEKDFENTIKIFSPKGKITKQAVDDLIGLCMKGKKEDVSHVIDEIEDMNLSKIDEEDDNQSDEEEKLDIESLDSSVIQD